MPIEGTANESLPNKHTIYVASSGGGKTQAMAANLRAEKGKKRVIVWNPHGSFSGLQCRSLPEFGRALQKHKDQASFAICYQGNKAGFEMFCRMVWAIARGDLVTHLVIDETAEVTESIGKDRSTMGEMMRGGRKFGLIIHTTAVSVAEIPNTIWRESKTKWIGTQDNISDLKRCADALVDINVDALKALQPLEYYVKFPNNSIEKKAVKYSKPPHRA